MLLLLIGGGRVVVQAMEAHTGEINTLFIGEALMTIGFPTPALLEDPKLSVTPVPAEPFSMSTKEIQRFTRIYLPRTRERLVENYQLIILSGVRSDHLSRMFEEWIRGGVIESGMGLLMADDPVSFGCVDAWAGAGSPSWMETTVGEILPVNDNSRVDWGRGYDFKIKLKLPEHPLMKGIPWDQLWFYAHNRPTAKPGATIIATTSQEQGWANPPDSPVLVYWDIGKGRSMALVFDWGGRPYAPFYRWEYWKDAVARWVYFPAGAEIPGDVELAHTLRRLISDYATKRGIVISMIEFADKFGANTRSVEKMMESIGEEREEADWLWIAGEFQDCLTKMQTILSKLDTVLDEAMKTKNMALFWIYLIEWTAVTGTTCIAGTLLWILMVRRRMYREVETTRLIA